MNVDGTTELPLGQYNEKFAKLYHNFWDFGMITFNFEKDRPDVVVGIFQDTPDNSIKIERRGPAGLKKEVAALNLRAETERLALMDVGNICHPKMQLGQITDILASSRHLRSAWHKEQDSSKTDGFLDTSWRYRTHWLYPRLDICTEPTIEPEKDYCLEATKISRSDWKYPFLPDRKPLKDPYPLDEPIITNTEQDRTAMLRMIYHRRTEDPDIQVPSINKDIGMLNFSLFCQQFHMNAVFGDVFSILHTQYGEEAALTFRLFQELPFHLIPVPEFNQFQQMKFAEMVKNYFFKKDGKLPPIQVLGSYFDQARKRTQAAIEKEIQDQQHRLTKLETLLKNQIVEKELDQLKARITGKQARQAMVENVENASIGPLTTRHMDDWTVMSADYEYLTSTQHQKKVCGDKKRRRIETWIQEEIKACSASPFYRTVENVEIAQIVNAEDEAVVAELYLEKKTIDYTAMDHNDDFILECDWEDINLLNLPTTCTISIEGLSDLSSCTESEKLSIYDDSDGGVLLEPEDCSPPIVTHIWSSNDSSSLGKEPEIWSSRPRGSDDATGNRCIETTCTTQDDTYHQKLARIFEQFPEYKKHLYNGCKRGSSASESSGVSTIHGLTDVSISDDEDNDDEYSDDGDRKDGEEYTAEIGNQTNVLIETDFSECKETLASQHCHTVQQETPASKLLLTAQKETPALKYFYTGKTLSTLTGSSEGSCFWITEENFKVQMDQIHMWTYDVAFAMFTGLCADNELGLP